MSAICGIYLNRDKAYDQVHTCIDYTLINTRNTTLKIMLNQTKSLSHPSKQYVKLLAHTRQNRQTEQDEGEIRRVT